MQGAVYADTNNAPSSALGTFPPAGRGRRGSFAPAAGGAAPPPEKLPCTVPFTLIPTTPPHPPSAPSPPLGGGEGVRLRRPLGERRRRLKSCHARCRLR